MKPAQDKATRVGRYMRVASIGRCRRGTSTIELALIAPLLTLFVLGMADTAGAIATRYSITKATIRTAELGLSVGPKNGGYDYLRSEAAEAASISPEMVRVEYWLECEYVIQSNVDTSCTSPDLPFRYIRVNARDQYNVRFLPNVFGSSIPLDASSVVRVQ